MAAARVVAWLATVAVLVVGFKGEARACVGKVLTVGAIDAPDQQLLAELISVLINERTGTTINVRLFAGTGDVYAAVARREVGILVESDANARAILRERGAVHDDDTKLREAYRQLFGLVWLDVLESVGAAGKTPNKLGPLLTNEVLQNYPALPRVVNKLGRVLDEAQWASMLADIRGGKKARNVARDFLDAKRLI